jgi:hypothetical protein
MFNVNVLYSNDILKDAVYNGNLLPLENRITPQQLMDFNPFELRILRNMIYAKYNYRFQSNDLQEYFSQFSWYNGTENDVEKSLTYIDHRNIKIIQTLEEHYPVIIPYNDERINDFLFYLYEEEQRYWSSGVHDRYRNQYLIGNILVIMGWGRDGELFYFITRNWFNSFGIRRERFDIIIEATERDRNIVPISDIILTNIEDYSIYLKEVRTIGYEIGLQNNLDNSTIKLDILDLGRLAEDDIFYLCVKSPFVENIISIIVIIPSWQGGDVDGNITYYRIYGIDLNTLMNRE